MKEVLIKKGQSHTLINLDRGEAFSFNSFGEPVGSVDAESAYRLGGFGMTEVKIVSFVGKKSVVDIYFDGKHTTIKGTTVLDCQSKCRKSLTPASIIPYRINHGNGVTQVLLAMDYSTSRDSINRLFDIVDNSWEDL